MGNGSCLNQWNLYNGVNGEKSVTVILRIEHLFRSTSSALSDAFDNDLRNFILAKKLKQTSESFEASVAEEVLCMNEKHL